MLCKLCNKNIDKKFYRHLNQHHSIGGGHRGHVRKMTIKYYFQLFPEQKEEYESQKCGSWCKGLTKETSPIVARISSAVKEYSSQDWVRKKRSEKMKERYKFGDIISPEQRAIIVKKGSDGWVNKLKSLTFEERKEALEKFTSAGNMAQQERREFLTPEDYQKLYPFAKGKAAYCNCKYCGKQLIGWFGGKPRPKNRFCNGECWNNYRDAHPHYTYPRSKRYYSNKMGMEFFLCSKIEEWVARILDENECILSWSTTPFVIYYYADGKKRRYYPDFFINGKYILEVKSLYFFNLYKENVLLKIDAAEKFCENNGYNYLYWQFNKTNLKYKDVVSDSRIIDFLSQERMGN